MTWSIGLGVTALAEPFGRAVPAKGRNVRDDTQFKGMRLNGQRKLAGIHDQEVFHDPPPVMDAYHGS